MKRAQAVQRAAACALHDAPCAGVLSETVREGCPAIAGHVVAERTARQEIDAIDEARAELITEDTEAAADLIAVSAEYQAASDSYADAAALVEVGRDQHAALRSILAALKPEVIQQDADELARAEAEAEGLAPGIEDARRVQEEAVAQVSTAVVASAAAAEVLMERQGLLAAAGIRVLGLRAGDRSAALDVAEREASTIRGRLDVARPVAEDAAVRAAQIAALVVPVPLDLRAAENTVVETEAAALVAAAEATTASMAVARACAAVEVAQNVARQAADLVAKLAPVERDLADWRFLARGLGREGIQALELDAAGPRVSSSANELLAAAYGSRFQIRFETQVALASGKGVRETFDVIVLDTERGREGDGSDLSGGEKVIVGEALGLAVGLFHGRAAGVSLGTVIRDETVGALDPENGERYLALLRSFVRIGQVHQLLFVCHAPGLVDLADAVVRVENGRISVVS